MRPNPCVRPGNVASINTAAKTTFTRLENHGPVFFGAGGPLDDVVELSNMRQEFYSL